jgi:hypothetical protein
MFSILSLALALQVTVRVERQEQSLKSDSARAAEDSANRKARKHPVTPELERSAFRDPAARALLVKARAARLTQDSALLAYDATAYQRLSVGMGIRAIGRERLLLRTENVSRVRWSRANGLHIDLKGRRTVFPMLQADQSGDADMDDISPVPFFPGRDALWIGAGNGIAKAEVKEDELIHPLASGAEAYYRYAIGDSLTLRLSDGRSIQLRELRIEPRKPEWRLSVGSFWFDDATGQLVRAAYRFSAEMDIWKVAREEIEADGDDDEPPKWVMALISPLRANLESVTIDYGLFGGRFWLPRSQTAEAWARASFMRVPVKIQESFKYADVNGVDTLAPVPKAPRTLRDSLFGDSARWRDLTPEQRRERALRIAEADSVRREQRRAARKEQCATSGTYVRYETRYDGAVRTAVTMPCDTTVLAKSPDLPASIYDPGEELFGSTERDELLKSLGFGLQSGWAPQRPTVEYGFDLMRYNRVEGFSAGAIARQELGNGYRASLLGRLGTADLEPNGELTGTRSNGRRQLSATVFRRLNAANDWGSPLSFGAGFSALVFGRDEGFYYRAWGGELSGSNVRESGFSWRLFAEHHGDAPQETEFSFAHAINDVAFVDNIDALNGTIGGGAFRFNGSLGIDPQGWRLLSDIRGEAAGGTFDYTRGAMDLTLSHGIGRRLTAALTASAGTSGGLLPPQRMWYLGGSQTVRGQRPTLPTPGDSTRPADPALGFTGNSYWLGRFELGTAFSAARPVIFGDLGWAGDRSSWSHIGRPLSGVGVGASFLDGLVRMDLARGIYPSKRVRFDMYLEARF